ncbi:hypothetical protein N321_01870, partial [Antrostomus carolinensis]
GSLGLDLATAVDFTLIDNKPQKIATTTRGPLEINSQPYGALILGRSSTRLKGLFVLPGLIDADFTGIISITCQTQFPPIFVPAGSRVAQLIPLPQLVAGIPAASEAPRGDKGLGSTGAAAMLIVSMKRRPVASVLFKN